MKFTLSELAQARGLIDKVVRNDSLTAFEVAVLNRFGEAIDSGALHLTGVTIKEQAIVLSEREDKLTLSERQQKFIELVALENNIPMNTTAQMDQAFSIAFRRNPKLFETQGGE